MKAFSPFHAPIVASVCLSIFAATEAQAANTWDGGSLLNSNWGTAANWDNDAAPSFPGGLTFGGTTRLNPFNDLLTTVQVNGFTFAAGASAFNISGNAVTLAGNIINASSNAQTIGLNMGFSGATIRTIDLSGGSAVTLSGNISGAGGFTTTGAQSGTITLGGSNSYSGGFTFATNSGYSKTLNLASSTALGSGTLTLSPGNTGTSKLDNTSGAAMTISNAVSIGGSGINRFINSNALRITGDVTNSAATAKIQVDASTLTLAGNVFLSNIAETAKNLQVQGAGNLTIEGVVSNFNGAGGTAGGITKIDSGTLTLSNTANTYTGATLFSGAAGTIVVTKLANGGEASSIGASSSSAANLGATINPSTGVLRYMGSGDSTDRLFTLGNTGVTFTIESSGSGALHFTNSDPITTGGSGVKTLELGGTYTGAANTMAVNVTTNGGTGNVQLRKVGAGTWNLTNANGYTGTTTVNGGTLGVSGTGSINSTSGVTVNGSGSKFNYTSSTGLNRNVTLNSGGAFFHSGAANYTGTLTWTNGVIGGTNWNGSLGGLTVGANQILSPGNSVGSAATTSQTWASLGAFDFEVNKANGTAGLASGGWDFLNLSSKLSITATSESKFTLNIISLGLDNLPGATDSFVSSTNYKWLFVDSADAIVGFSVDKFEINTDGFTNAFTGTFGVALGDAFGIGGDNSQLYIVYTVPEQNTVLLLGIGLLTVLQLRRRRA